MSIELIAEIGQNHNGDMDLAVNLIREAKLAGADVAKFQLFEARKLFSREGNPWFEYNVKTEISREQLHVLRDACDAVGIEFMASAFDSERVGWLEEIAVARHKIASRSISNHALVDTITQTGKPIIASLGMWSGEDLPDIGDNGQVSFLYCISSYPAKASDFQFSNVDFEKLAGFSDHSEGLHAAKIAVSHGARIIEKHFTLNKSLEGPDHKGSMTPDELRDLSEFCQFFRESW
jgi:sialic acid synthase SpsE